MSGDNSKIWHTVNIAVKKNAAEAVEFALDQMNSLGSAIDQLRRADDDAVTVIGYFDELPREGDLRDELQNSLRIYELDPDAIRGITFDKVENTDWLIEWKKHWQPTEIGRFVVAPPWSDVAEAGKIIIRIEPNMAFGTGTHDTTQLCLRAIDENYVPTMSLLDVGTGTGILAIAAARLASERAESSAEKGDPASSGQPVFSAAKIVACDTDEDSVKIARENAIANGVDDRIELALGTINGETAVFDLVCANLTLDVITPLLPLLIERSRRLLLLSGILAEQENAIMKELTRLEIADLDIGRSGEWISILVRKG